MQARKSQRVKMANQLNSLPLHLQFYFVTNKSEKVIIITDLRVAFENKDVISGVESCPFKEPQSNNKRTGYSIL